MHETGIDAWTDNTARHRRGLKDPLMQNVATTTSVLATGKPPQCGHHARGWQVSWLAGRGF